MEVHMLSQIRRSLKLALLVLLLLPYSVTLLEAQTPPGGTKKIDPCSLLTKAEIQEALGQPVQDGKLNTRANPAVGAPCEYVVGDYGAFSILVKPFGPGETPDKMLAQLNKMKMKTADAPGIGDKSFFAFPGYGMLQLNTFKGSQYLIMTLLVPGLSEDAQKVPAEKLMKIVLSKL
jgi:hypothetical protein